MTPEIKASLENKIFCGKEVFNSLKKLKGILYGNEFNSGSVVFVCVNELKDLELMTWDPKLVKLLKELEDELGIPSRRS